MNNALRGIFLVAAMILLMSQAVLAEAYRHEATGIVFPEYIATLVREAQRTDFESENPGLGISFGYSDLGIKVTVYVYTMGLPTIPDDLGSSIVKAQFQQTVDDVIGAGKAGYYSNVKKIFEGETAWGNAGTKTRSLQASFTYNQNGQDCLSHVYLLGFKNHFVKVRLTYDKEVQESAEKTQKAFLEEFGRILEGIGKEHATQRLDVKKTA